MGIYFEEVESEPCSVGACSQSSGSEYLDAKSPDHLSIEQLELHLVHEGPVVGVDEDGLVVHGVVVDKLNVAHAGWPIDVLQPPLNPE